MTFLGIILIVLLVISLFKPYKCTVGLLLITCIFQASSAININGKGVQPYLIGSIFLIIRTCLRNPGFVSSLLKTRFTLLVLFFMIYIMLVSILMPFVFEGVSVFDKNLDDSVINGAIRLKFGLNNITQLGYIFINCLTLCSLWINKTKISHRELKLFFYLSVLLLLVIGFWEFTSKYMGKGYFPSSFFYTNYSMDGEAYIGSVEGAFRMNATMTEASFLGAMLAASFWALIVCYSYRKDFGILILVILVGIALILNLSGTGIITFLLGSMVFIWLIGIRFKLIFQLLVVTALLFFIAFISGYGSYITTMLLDKQESQSGIVRTIATLNSWDLFCHSYGLGVGLGSNRGGSFFFDLLASLGIVGTLLFYSIFVKLILCCKKSKEGMFICVYLLVLMIAQCAAIPDLSFCCMWLGLYMAASFNFKDGGGIISDKHLLKHV